MKPFYEIRPDQFFVGKICDHPFPSHVHDVVEIVFMTRGSLEMTVGGKTYGLRPGDTAAVFPSVPHSYNAVSRDAEGVAMIFQPDAIQEYVGVFRSVRPENPFYLHESAPVELEQAAGKLWEFSKIPGSPQMLAYLHVFLSYLLPYLPLLPMERFAESGITHQVLQYISQHFKEDLTLESTARALGISRSHLSHIFSQQLNVSFRQYINTLRIDRACFLLRDPQYSITEIAFMCGYENSRTFHRAFLNEKGMQPSQYRSAAGKLPIEV